MQWILAILIVGAALGAWQLLDRGPLPDAKPGPPAAPDKLAASPAPEKAVWTGPSIEALAKHEFDGRDFAVGEALDRQSAYTRFSITYRSGALTISGIMNVPAGDGPFPVLILNHGYIDPAIYTNGRGLRREQDYLARQGFVVIHPDYRNHAQSSRVDDGELENRLGYVEDVINAVYAVRAAGLPYVDGGRIGMLGHSMGGGIAQTVAVAKPDLVRAIALYAPVSMDYRDSYFKYMAQDGERARRIVERYGPPEAGSPVWDAISPRTYVDRIAVPMILFQGTRDDSVPAEWSDRTAALLRERGKPIEYVVYPGEGHEFGPRWDDFMSRTADFFREHLAR
ncbi:MAG: alpha/beta fold hydrolase [Candidatus Moraniibacteriota bacterium]|nr:MAG: alpha/beta fold hydrolase [Candidatus Moranbacteria bacterium]